MIDEFVAVVISNIIRIDYHYEAMTGFVATGPEKVAIIPFQVSI